MKLSTIVFTFLFIIIPHLSLLFPTENSVTNDNNVLVIKSKGISFIGSGITLEDAKAFAIIDAKRNALEMAGTYIEANSLISNNIIIKDEINSFTGSILQIDINEYEKVIFENTFTLNVDITAKIDLTILNKKISETKNNFLLKKKLLEERERNKRYEDKISKLQDTLKDVIGDKTVVSNIIERLNAKTWFDKGKKAHLNKEYLKAIDYYSYSIELDSSFSMAFFNRGVVNKLLGNYIKAIKDYLISAKKDILLKPYVYNNIGVCYKYLQKYKNANIFFNKAIDTNSDIYLQAIYNRGLIFNLKGEYKNAVKDFNKVIASPKQVSKQPYYNRAIAYFHLKKYNKSIEDFNTVLNLDKKDFNSYNNRGFAYNKLKDHYKALSDFTSAIKLDEEYADAYFNRAMVYKDLDEKKLAINDLKRYIDKSHLKNDKDRGKYELSMLE